MLAKIIYFDCGMLILDLITIYDLRDFLLDFIRVKKNTNPVRATQSLRDKIMLSFIKAHLKKYIKEFTAFHKLYVVVVFI